MTYGDFKDLTGRTASYKILPDKAFIIAKNPKDGEHQRGIASIVQNVFDKETSATSANKFACSVTKNENILNKKLVEKLHKPIARKLKKKKIQSYYIDSIWVADLANMQLLTKFNKGIPYR